MTFLNKRNSLSLVTLFTPLLARSFTQSPSSRHPPFIQYPFPSRSLLRDGQTSQHMPRLVVPHITCPSLSPSPPAHSLIKGPAAINTHTTPLSQVQVVGSRGTTGPRKEEKKEAQRQIFRGPVTESLLIPSSQNLSSRQSEQVPAARRGTALPHCG